MKKFFEKHDLFKLVGIVLLISIILTWILASGSFTGDAFSSSGITRVGLFDLSTYAFLPVYYFTVTFIALFVIGGFYKFLGSTEAYAKLTNKIATFFEGKEIIFVGISTTILAVLTGVTTDYFSLLLFIPFFITILSKLKVDKVSGLCATFGGVMVGLLGATFSTKINGVIVSAFGLEYGNEIITLSILFAIALILMVYFTALRMRASKKKGYALLEDPFASEVKVSKVSKNKKEVSIIPISIILGIAALIFVLAYIGWGTAFANVTCFKNAHEWLTSATIGGQAVYSYILGSSFSAFGSWDLFSAACVLFIASLIIKFVYKIPFDKLLEEFKEGAKKMVKPAIILMLIFAVLVISVIFPVVPNIVNKIMGMGENMFSIVLSSIFAGLFGVEFQYATTLVGQLFATFSNPSAAAVSLQGIYGVLQFIAPTSIFLMLGLSLLDIKYTDYVKHIWKFLAAITVVVLVIIAILLYV